MSGTSNKYHDLPPGVSGATRGYLVLTVDEIVWLVDLGTQDTSCHVRAEWWGSRREQQVVFAPVDVRNFVQTGLMIHSYPVHTGPDKLRRYLADASPLSLALHLATQREAVGRARVGLAGAGVNIEGYFPVLDNEGRELATLHLKLDYVDVESSVAKLNEIKEKGKAKNSRVTFKQHNIEHSSTDNSSKNTRATGGGTPAVRSNEAGPETDGFKRTEENISLLSNFSLPSNVSIKSTVPKVSRVREQPSTFSLKIHKFMLKTFIFDKLYKVYIKDKVGTSHAKQVAPKIFVFVKFTFPEKREETFCTRLTENNNIEFAESKIIEDVNTDSVQWKCSKIDFDISLRVMGQKNSVHVGSAALPLTSFTPGTAPVSAAITAAASLGSQLNMTLAPGDKNIGSMALLVSEEAVRHSHVVTVESVASTGEAGRESSLSPREPHPPARRLIPNQGSAGGGLASGVADPVYLRLSVGCRDPDMARWADLRVKWWTGRQCHGLGSLQCAEVLLRPGPGGRYYNRQAVSALRDNYLVLEVWRRDTIAAIARVPTHAVPGAASCWSAEGGQVTCFEDTVAVVSLATGNLVGHLAVELCLDTADTLPTNVDTEDDVEEITGDYQDDVERDNIDDQVSIATQTIADSVDNIEEDPPSATKHAVVHLEEVRLSKAGCLVYCSLPCGATSDCFSSDQPEWDAHLHTELPVAGDTAHAQLIVRLWRAEQQRPDSEADKMLGFVSVDCSPLCLGFPFIRGWYNIIDWLGKPKGQVKLTVKPYQPLAPDFASLPPPARDQSTNPDAMMWELHQPQPGPVDNRYLVTVNNSADIQGESLSFMELTLSKHLNDLNMMTNKLVSECNEDCDNDKEARSRALVCDLGVLEECLRISNLHTANIQTDRSDKSRVGPEGGNAE